MHASLRRLLLLLLLGVRPMQAETVRVLFDASVPQAAFSASDVQAALKARGHTPRPSSLKASELQGACIVLAPQDHPLARGRAGKLASEGFSVRPEPPITWVIGGDAAGLVYGGLEVAEIIRASGLAGIRAADQNPYMAMRGTKFNIPLDVRTPSYSHPSDAAQNNIATVWDMAFWTEYIDLLARYRYNFVSLWSLHPFPSLVRVPAYPDIALDDVKRSTGKWKEYYSTSGLGFDAPEIQANTETLKTMTLDQKIDFWRRVMAYGKSRNVDFCFVTWNIFTNGTAGKYGITDKATNPKTTDYFRKSVAQMFLTYPDLRGIGLTTGENMHRMSPKQKEDWAFATYGQGVLDAARAQPGRKIRFIHRQHMTDHEMIQERFAPLIEHPDIDFIYSFKYAKAHCFSSVTQPYHRKFVQGIGKTKTIWTLRNDDVFHLRWGGPDFVRTFIRNIPYDVSQGFYYGSDNYIWGREFLSTEPDSPRQLEIDKHWYHWMIWGRLGYDPDLSNERFTQIIQTRFPKVDAKALFEAWQEASMIFPVTTGYHWGSIDIKWYIEGCRSHPKFTALKTGFHGVEAFITQAVHPSTDNVRIPDYVKAVAAGKKVDGTTPIAVAERLHGHADKALARVNDLRHSGNKELRLTLDDIRAMARLGKYYAYKIRGAAELALFRKIRKEARQARAVAELNHAAHHYRVYASLMVGMYRNPLWTNRDGYVDWRKQMAFVLDDVRTAGGAPALAPMAPTPGGAIHEAEDAKLSDRAVTATKMAAFTGKGYVDVSAGATLTWAVDATRSGTHVLELRYATDDVTLRPAKVLVNGKTTGDIILWSTGGTWGWDRKPATLRKGANSIAIAFAGAASVDHLNVIGTHDD